MIIYNKSTNELIGEIPNDVDMMYYFSMYPQEFKDDLGSLEVENIPRDVKSNPAHYKVVDNKLTMRVEKEIQDLDVYGKVLTEEERVDIGIAKEQNELKKNESKAIQTFAKMSFQMTAPNLTPTQILQFEPLVEDWLPGTYIIGDIRKHLGQVWKCVQGHNNINNPDIEPGKSPAQWVAYKSKDIKYAKAYIQPQGAHDAYMKDEYCIFNDKTYKSKIDNNVWTPTAYPVGWKEMIK